MSPYTTDSPKIYTVELRPLAENAVQRSRLYLNLKVFIAAVFLVAVPVFFQAPLVRSLPWFSLGLTAGWLGLSLWAMRRPRWSLWGDLLFGFTWTWLAGSLYWGWLRWEPFFHLPVEAIGLPFAIWCLFKRWGAVGNYFYLGSLFGTALTDVYFYLVNLIPYWRQLMQVEPTEAGPVFHAALLQIQSLWGVGAALVLISLLLVVGAVPLRSSAPKWWAFGGAVLSTLLVDGLFFLAARLA